MVANPPKVQAAFKNGRGVVWGEQASCMFCAVARMFRPGYVNALVQEWLPALDGVVHKLEAGAKVADRRFMPGDTDLATVDQSQLVALAHHLNSQQRECLGFNTRRDVHGTFAGR